MRDSQGLDLPGGVAAQDQAHLAGVQVPDPSQSVIAGRNQSMAMMEECDAKKDPFEPKRLLRLLVRLHVPDPYLPVQAGTCQQRPIRRKGQTVDAACMAG